MTPTPFQVDVDEALKNFPEQERIKFEKEVDDYIGDTSRLIENRLPINPNREIVRQALYREVYCYRHL